MIVLEVRRYVAPSGSDVIGDWLASLADLKARARIAARLDRLSLGNFGDCKALLDGVYELRIDWGPGYRVYFGWWARHACFYCAEATSAGSRPTQKRAIEYRKDFQERTRSK